MPRGTVIVGANLAGGRAAVGLRQQGYDRPIVLVGDEPEVPYERPPLSKELLWGEKALAHICLHPPAFYEEQRIELRLGARAHKLDCARAAVVLEDGEELRADTVVLATGGRPRRLAVEGADLAGVRYLRSHADALALRGDLVPGAKVVVVGMGVIGAEVAASAMRLGCQVACVEATEVPMSRIFGRRFGEWLARKHLREGVGVRLATGVRRFVCRGGRLTGVETTAGELLAADVAVVGIGIDPAVELARDAGIEVLTQGIKVDRACRTSEPKVYAAGDVAAQACFFSGRPVRVETFQNAQDQGLAVAAAIAGKPVEHCSPAWFWTDQYNLNVQAAGLVGDAHDAITRGDPESERFSIFFLRSGVVEGALTVNAPQDMAVARRIVDRRMAVSAALLADTAVPLRALLAAKPARATA